MFKQQNRRNKSKFDILYYNNKDLISRVSKNKSDKLFFEYNRLSAVTCE